ncbi:hypothetical protein LJC57_10195 [Parabacteroides sp. OttesenSCG-928-G07]|nr:hypothetical protein [Parabacteroides sp. OttesenSCG-928-G07]
MQVQDDSLYIDLHFRVKEINVATDKLLILVLSLQSGPKETVLPDIVFTGKRKARYDTRNRILDGSKPLYQPYYEYRGTRTGGIYTFDYVVKIPFSPWMSNARLKLTQIHGDCCSQWEYIQILDPDINLEYKVIVYEENKL